MTTACKARITKHNWIDLNPIYVLSELDSDDIIQTAPTYNDIKHFADSHLYIITDYVEFDHFPSAS